MAGHVPYDDFAEIYDPWVGSAPITGAMRDFYVELLTESPGPLVELGVGNGHICVEVARRGREIVGVDSSTAILELCRARAQEADVGSRLELLQADFRDFELDRPASLIALPFHSLGHLLEEAGKRLCMEQVFSQLRPGGRFVWDHFVFDPAYLVEAGEERLRAEHLHPETGAQQHIWERFSHDLERQVIEVLVRIETLEAAGARSEREVRMTMSWIDPKRSRELLEATGFEIEALFGDFERGPFETDSSHQVWIARRPRA